MPVGPKSASMRAWRACHMRQPCPRTTSEMPAWSSAQMGAPWVAAVGGTDPVHVRGAPARQAYMRRARAVRGGAVLAHGQEPVQKCILTENLLYTLLVLVY